jgi:glycosyltransferase involved in cell wall biosynthesis
MSLLASERRALSRVRHIITTSETTKSILLSDFGVAADWVSVVRPGVERVTCPVRREGKNVSLLAVGSIVPRKGYDVLIAALAMLKDLPWHLMIVGDRMRDTTTAARIDDLVREHALADRIVMTGAVPNERLATLYMNADVFVLPSRYEGYGMAFVDAIAYGLPVIGTTGGAIPEAVPSEASVLVPPDDVSALASALRRVIGDEDIRRSLAESARRAAQSLSTWEESGHAFARILEALA